MIELLFKIRSNQCWIRDNTALRSKGLKEPKNDRATARSLVEDNAGKTKLCDCGCILIHIAVINGIARRNHYPVNGSATVLLHTGTRANKMAVELIKLPISWEQIHSSRSQCGLPLALSWTDDDKTGESYWL